jgi:hypothetical protein
MKLRGHVKILGVVTLAWVLFWLIGLPAYYQQYSLRFMLLFDTVLLLPLSFLLYWILKRTPRQYRTRLSFWLAFYISVPLFVYDYLYCSLYLGDGWSFLTRYWYLTVYYVVPWIISPAISYWINHRAMSEQTLEVTH